MSYIYTCLGRMVVFLVAISALIGFYIHQVKEAFSQNIYLNSVIFFIGIFGVFWTLVTQIRMMKNLRFFEEIKIQCDGTRQFPYQLNPLADYFLSPVPTNASNIINTISLRFDEMRDASRYVIGILIFLGLLGTFWGLTQTLSSISNVIGKISLLGKDVGGAFQSLKDGLLSPLEGMGTAFSSSLFGLVGSLSVGFLDFQNAASIQRFVGYIEDTLPYKPLNKSSGIAYINSLLELNAHQTAQLLISIKQHEESRMQTLKMIEHVNLKLDELGANLIKNQEIFKKLAQSHLDLQDFVKQTKIAQEDTKSTMSLRQINLQCERFNQEIVSTREQLSKDMHMVAKTISLLQKN